MPNETASFMLDCRPDIDKLNFVHLRLFLFQTTANNRSMRCVACIVLVELCDGMGGTLPGFRGKQQGHVVISLHMGLLQPVKLLLGSFRHQHKCSSGFDWLWLRELLEPSALGKPALQLKSFLELQPNQTGGQCKLCNVQNLLTKVTT